MATLTAARAASTFPVSKPAVGGVMCAAYGVIELAANPTTADIAQMCRIPAGATVVGGWLYGDDIDTGTEALDIDIGWAANGTDVADPDGFGNLGVLTGDASGSVPAVAGIMVPLQGVLLTDGPKTFAAETIIQLVFNAPANAGGTGTLSLVVHYVI